MSLCPVTTGIAHPGTLRTEAISLNVPLDVISQSCEGAGWSRTRVFSLLCEEGMDLGIPPTMIEKPVKENVGRREALGFRPF